MSAHSTLRNGSLESQIFLSICVLVIAWLAFFQDWTPLRQVKIQSPITFVMPDQPSLAAVPDTESSEKARQPDTIRTAAAFDLSAVAKAQNITLRAEDKTLDQLRQDYIRKYGAVAVAEMRKYGIPASITLAQGLLETRAGTSSLAKKNNNHFGMKCFSRSCSKGHCSNFSDDTHKDFFLKFNSAWASYRAHSHLLSTGRYKALKQYGNNHVEWAKGLKRLGYATDAEYDTNLIRLIRLYGLDRLDK